MKIYKCTVGYRYYGCRGPVLCKVLLIEADDPVAAFVKASQETKNLYQVSEPEIEEFVIPHIDFNYTKKEAIKEFGTKEYEKAKEYLSYGTIRKTSDGSKRDYLY